VDGGRNFEFEDIELGEYLRYIVVSLTTQLPSQIMFDVEDS